MGYVSCGGGLAYPLPAALSGPGQSKKVIWGALPVKSGQIAGYQYT
jgi:hypothetical protein